MKALAEKLNPAVGFWDPLNIAGPDAMPETIGWFRHAEIKHGRVAMAAFVGYCLQSNGVCFPWALQKSFAGYDVPTINFADISAAGGPADQWDALPTPAKLQILGVIGFLEMWSETSSVLKMDGEQNYVRGGKPGYFPKLSRSDEMAFPHPVPLNLWDPFGFTSKMTPERKEKSQGSGASELPLGAVHGTVEVIAGDLGVLRHLLQHLLLELGASSSVESEVAGHLGAHRRDVGLAVGHLVGDLLLHVVEVIHETHAAIGGLRVDLTGLEHVSGPHRGASVHAALHNLVNELITAIGGDVHHGAAHGKPAEERERSARRLLLRGLGVHLVA